MALTHQAFLLEIDGFKKNITPVIDSLNSGTAETLYKNATQVFQTNQKNWALNSIDGDLTNIQYQNFAGIPYKKPIEPLLNDLSNLQSADIGYWFLMILSTYLEKIDGIGFDFKIFEWCLEKIGWNADDIKLLIYAMPTSVMLKVDTDIQPKKLSHSDPYWFWVRPAYAKESGWLSKQQISYLLDKLRFAEKSINAFDPNLFGLQWGMMPISLPEGQIDYLNRAKIAYQSTIQMLETAVRRNKDLYIVISEM